MSRRSSTVVPLHITLPIEIAQWLETEAARRFMTRGSLLAQLAAAERDRLKTPEQLPLIHGRLSDESGR